MVSKDAKTKKEDFTEITDPMRQNGEYSCFHPLREQDIIEKLGDEISGVSNLTLMLYYRFQTVLHTLNFS